MRGSTSYHAHVCSTTVADLLFMSSHLTVVYSIMERHRDVISTSALVALEE